MQIWQNKHLRMQQWRIFIVESYPWPSSFVHGTGTSQRNSMTLQKVPWLSLSPSLWHTQSQKHICTHKISLYFLLPRRPLPHEMHQPAPPLDEQYVGLFIWAGALQSRQQVAEITQLHRGYDKQTFRISSLQLSCISENPQYNFVWENDLYKIKTCMFFLIYFLCVKNLFVTVIVGVCAIIE